MRWCVRPSPHEGSPALPTWCVPVRLLILSTAAMVVMAMGKRAVERRRRRRRGRREAKVIQHSTPFSLACTRARTYIALLCGASSPTSPCSPDAARPVAIVSPPANPLPHNGRHFSGVAMVFALAAYARASARA